MNMDVSISPNDPAYRNYFVYMLMYSVPGTMPGSISGTSISLITADHDIQLFVTQDIFWTAEGERVLVPEGIYLMGTDIDNQSLSKKFRQKLPGYKQPISFEYKCDGPCIYLAPFEGDADLHGGSERRRSTGFKRFYKLLTSRVYREFTIAMVVIDVKWPDTSLASEFWRKKRSLGSMGDCFTLPT